jgi:hypothetical protein
MRQENVACEPCIKISDNIKKTFIDFRQELGNIMQQNKSEKDSGIIKYPGTYIKIKEEFK